MDEKQAAQPSPIHGRQAIRHLRTDKPRPGRRADRSTHHSIFSQTQTVKERIRMKTDAKDILPGNSKGAALPGVIDAYFRASNANDIPTLVGCFAPNATVADENEEHRGVAAIEAWAINVRKKYQFGIRVRRAVATPHGATVTAEVSGTFPGSPVELDFNFAVEKGKLTSLTIG